MKKLLLLSLVLTVCCAACYALSGSLSVDTQKIINHGIIGPGVNFSFSDYEYYNMITGDDWGVCDSRQVPAPWEKENWKDFNRLMDTAGFSYIRLCVGLTQWEPVNDNSNPFVTDFDGGFIFSPNFRAVHPELEEIKYKNDKAYMDSLYVLLDKWEKEGKYVVLGNWDEGKDNFCGSSGNWLVKLADDQNKNRTALHADISEMTESLAAIMYHLIAEKGYTCIKGISFYNEPEGLGNYYNTLSEVYGTLDAQLTRLGIRDKVLIQGFDGSVVYNRENGAVPDGVSRLLNQAGSSIDIVSFHDYWTYFDYIKEKPKGVHGTIKEFDEANMLPNVMKQIDEYNKTHGRDIFYVVGEMGSFMYSDNESRKAVYQQRLHNAEYTARVLNAGVKAVGYWVYNTNLHSHWRFVTFDDNRRWCPDAVNFYPMALTMRYIRGGSDIAESIVKDCRDSDGIQRVWSTCAVKGNKITVLLVNDGHEAAEISLPKKLQGMRHLYVTEKKSDNIYTASRRAGDTITLEAESINILTNYQD